MSLQDPADDAGEPAQPSWETVEITRIREREATIRYVTKSVCITLGLAIVTYGIVKALDKPPWLQALSIIAAGAPGPGFVIRRLILSRRKYVKKTHRRIVDLEKTIDPERESSEPEETPPGR